MRASLRFDLKTLMTAVALIALTFGIAIELGNRQGRDSNAAAEDRHRQRIAWHEEQAEVCRVSILEGRLFPKKERNNVLRRGARTMEIPVDEIAFKNWKTEAAYHHYHIVTLTPEAEACDRRKRDYQRRLLWPF